MKLGNNFDVNILKLIALINFATIRIIIIIIIRITIYDIVLFQHGTFSWP